MKLSSGIRSVFAVAILGLFTQVGWASTRITTTVLKISDGDTIQADNPDFDPSKKGSKRYLKVRFLGMDTPETDFQKQAQLPWGPEATKHLKELLHLTDAKLDKGGAVIKGFEPVDRDTGKRVEIVLELHGKDKYDRDLAYVIYQGTNINLKMMEDGMGFPYLYCDEKRCNKDWEKDGMVTEFVEACKDARRNKRGFFADANPLKETPSEFRRRIGKSKPYQFVGDYDSKKLYKPTDDNKVDPCSVIRFDTDADAIAHGYKY